MSVRKELLEILVCPRSKKPLVLDGDRLVSTDPETRLAYRIENGIPIMLLDEAVALDPEEWRAVMERHQKQRETVSNP
ncbi:MAG: hypothetical protein KatS3mg115_0421 [Candidatus Poribacteria bacterium]|nr:MAG: hypothetical protein KatS3mg115_0421 [Candidatus Poribacteria bacterium]